MNQDQSALCMCVEGGEGWEHSINHDFYKKFLTVWQWIVLDHPTLDGEILM